MSYSLTYYSNNGKGETKGGEYTTPGYLESEIFSTDGYILYCWNTKADGTGTVYEPHQVIVDDDQGRAIGGSLYAIWRIKNQGQIRVQNGDTIVDISDICDGIYKVAGKNQPYNFITFGLIKNMFNDTSDGGYWKTRQAIDPTAQKPELIQRQTKILVNVYGIVGEWRFEKTDEDDDTLWKVTAVCRAYNMKSTTLESLLSFTITTNTDVNGDTYPSFTFHRLGDLNRAAEISAVNRYTVSVPVEYRNRLNQTISENVTVSIDTSQTPMIEKVIGTGTGVFALIAKYCGGYTGTLTSTNRIFIDDGFIYDFTNGTYNTVQSSYTQLEIEQIKARAKLPLIGTVQGRSYDAKNVELRPDEYCSTILQGLSYLSNRAVFFDEDAYFVDYQVGSGSSRSEIIQYEFIDPLTYDSAEKIKIDWGGDNTVQSGYFVPEILGLSSNADQGSKYILQSQKVISENYERTVSISDSQSSISGEDIKYMYREDVSDSFVFSTATRNFQTSIIALNQIVNWYKPGDAIQYNMCETKKEYTYTVETYAELITYPAGGNDKPYKGLVLGPNDFRGKVYKGSWDGTAWVWASEGDYTEEDYSNLSRDVRYKAYSVASEIVDVQNDFTLTNVPLSAYVVSYPSCMTTYIWGNPAFMDEETELSDVSAITFDSTLDNTSDSQISDNYAAKIVVGNQSLAELQDNRSGYTGLILEKNWDVDLFRLAGYKEGVVQAQFNTEGKITAGGGVIVLDDSGMKTYNDSSNITPDNWVTHIDTNGSFNTGNKNGVGYVALNDLGLNIYYDKGEWSQANALNIRDISNPDKVVVTTQIYNKYLSATSTDVARIEAHIDTNIDNEGNATALVLQCQGTAAGTVTHTLKSLNDKLVISNNHGGVTTGFESMISSATGRCHTLFGEHVKDGESVISTVYASDGSNIDLSLFKTQGATTKFNFTMNPNDEEGKLWPVAPKLFVRLHMSDGSVMSSPPSNTWADYTKEMDVSGYDGINKIEFCVKNRSSAYDLLFSVDIFNVSITTKTADTSPYFKMIPYDQVFPIRLSTSTKIGTDNANSHELQGTTRIWPVFRVENSSGDYIFSINGDGKSGYIQQDLAKSLGYWLATYYFDDRYERK